MAKTILEALNKLVEKQGGTTEDNKLIVDAINDLVETGGGGGGGSSEPLFINVTFNVNPSNPTQFTVEGDKKGTEIRDAALSGKKIFLKATENELSAYYELVNLVSYPASDGDPGVIFAQYYDAGRYVMVDVSANDDDYLSGGAV